MKVSIFSRLMLYIGIFFLILCGLTYFALSTYFEVYYTQTRTDALMANTQQILEIYSREGLTPELQSRIAAIGEEGTVIQIIQNNTTSGESSTPQGNMGGTMNGGGQGQRQGMGQGNGLGQQKSFETQMAGHQDGQSFMMVSGNSDHTIEWLSYKKVAIDGAQIVGRIPFYSVHDVIQIVQKFLLVFLLIIFGCSLIFAYFFARGISKPIINLKDISKEMGNLNFTEKYKGTRKDEIGQLGETLNHISNELEGTIEMLQVELNKERTLEKMRQRFTVQVSHEIQTPLAVIKSYAEALEDGILETREEEKEYFITIEKEADKISGIASDLLDLSQIESGAYKLNKKNVLGAEVLESVIERFKHTYPEKNIQLKNKCDSKLMVNMDCKRIEQVLYNLLDNAIKHIVPEDGVIMVRSEMRSGTWAVSVYNVGMPIPENEIDQIWGYFYKAHSDKKGTGLGLAIVKGIIQCHGGQVAVENRESGVWFEVTLPLK